MIAPKDRNKENMRQATFVPKPRPQDWFGSMFGGNPEQMGLNRLQSKHSKKKKK